MESAYISMVLLLLFSSKTWSKGCTLGLPTQFNKSFRITLKHLAFKNVNPNVIDCARM